MISAHYDEPWKELLDDYFEPFLAFFFPKAHSLIDWTQPPEFLNTELLQLIPEATLGQRTVDKLVKVRRHDGEPTLLYIHIEIQSQQDPVLPQRMFVYHYRIFDRYSCPVVSLVLLGDDSPSWKPKRFGYRLGGTTLLLKFPAVKLLDHEAKWEELESNPSPIAMMVMAHLKTKRTTQDPQARKRWKWAVVRQLYERGYSHEDIVRLFRLIDWMMTLPDDLKREFNQEVQAYEEEKQMPIMSNIELMAQEKGKEAGILIGKEAGIQDLTLRQLHRKVGSVPSDIETQIRALPLDKLEQLGEALLDFESMPDLINWLAQA